MSKLKTNLVKSVRKDCAPKKVTEVFEKCTVTVQGGNIWTSGLLAEQLDAVAPQIDRTYQEVFNDCIRSGSPNEVVEFRAKRRRCP